MGLNRALVRAIVVGCVAASALLLPTIVAAAPTIEEREAYPRPVGTHCAPPLPGYNSSTPNGQTVCMDVADAQTYRQEIRTWHVDPATGTAGVWQPSTNRGWVAWPLNVCTYVYANMDQWAAYGSPTASNVCVKVDYELVTHEFRQWLLPELPIEMRDQFEPRLLYITEWRVLGRPPFAPESLATPQVGMHRGATAASICASFASSDSPKLARRTTPPELVTACGFDGIVDDGQTSGTTTGSGTTSGSGTSAGIVIPKASARCGLVRTPARRVVVRSVRMRCAISRRVIAAYARSLRSPRGWSCTATVRDSGMRVRCIRRGSRVGKARGRATVYGLVMPRT